LTAGPHPSSTTRRAYNTLSLALTRLDELQETFYARALVGDDRRAALVTKVI
jgi:hypothetical protein